MKFKEVKKIRDMYRFQGLSVSEISRRTGHTRKTVAKYLDENDFSPKEISIPGKKDYSKSKLGPFLVYIDGYLNDDLSAMRKQRHTARKVFSRLSKEVPGFNCSYSTVAGYVKTRKAELGMEPEKNPPAPLIHYPHEAQGDFGAASFFICGKEYIGKYFAVSFPYSNAGYALLNYGENTECLLEALDAIFRHIGGVPREIWLDNASSMVINVIFGGTKTMTETFARFAEHYNFRPVFMNSREPQGKGNVENKVGYVRSNMLVPRPKGKSLEEINRKLLEECDEDQVRRHYKKREFINKLFEENVRCLNPLPVKDFPLYQTVAVKADKTGMIKIDKKYHYSTSMSCAGRTVLARLTSDKVEIYDTEGTSIVVHPRLYGTAYESKDWRPYLSGMVFKPRALFNTGLPDLFALEMKMYLLQADNKERVRVLRITDAINKEEGFETAVDIMGDCFKSANPRIKLIDLFRKYFPDEVTDCEPEENRPAVDFGQYDLLAE